MNFEPFKKILKTTIEGAKGFPELHQKLVVKMHLLEALEHSSPDDAEAFAKLQNATDQLMAEHGAQLAREISRTVPKIPRE